MREIAWTRRGVLVGALGSIAMRPGFVLAQASQASLEQLRKAGVVRLGIVNQPPYSGLNPDGTITGLAPTMVQVIMGRLGVPKLEGIAVPYGQLIPGLQAGRWDMIGAVLNITKERCQQVTYADPLTEDAGALGFIPAALPAPPKTIGEAGQKGLKVGILTGSYLLKKAQGLGVADGMISQFPDNPALIDGLAAKRIDLALSTYSALRVVRKARGGSFEITYPLADDPPQGGSPAFRPTDTELHENFQRELRAMKKSGEFEKICQQFDFEASPHLLQLTAEQACAGAT